MGFRIIVRVGKKAVRFRKQDSGVVLILVALLLTVLIGIAAFAIDYARALDAKNQLQRAADAAALVAARAVTQQDAQTDLQNFVAANVSADVQAMNPVAQLASWQAGQAKILITANVPTPLYAIFGSSQIPVAVSSTAAKSINYFNIYAAVDETGSMGIASTPTDRANLEALTGGCEFACHFVDSDPPGPPDGPGSYYVLAKANNIQLREDVLNAAFNTFVTAVLTTNPDLTTQRAVDVIGFGSQQDLPEQGDLDPTQVAVVQDLTQGPSSDLTTVQNALQTFPSQYKLNTYYEAVLPMVQNIMGPQGDGYSQAHPRKMLVLITDGVRSDRHWNTWPIENPIDNSGNPMTSPANCDAIKNSGITLAVINVQYVSEAARNYNENSATYWFWYWVGNRRRDSTFTTPARTGNPYSELSPALEVCASQDPTNPSLPIGPYTGQPVWYFEATDSNGISTALQALLDAINQSSLRLTK